MADFPSGTSGEIFHNENEQCEGFHNKNDGCETSHMRLNRAIARSGICSRRRADELIIAGRIKVNGIQEINPATRVMRSDIISVDNEIISQRDPYTYLLLNKPIRTICTLKDPKGRRTVIDLLEPRFRNMRLFPVGRLDYFSEGLLLLTNDGELANRLTHPRFHLLKKYEVVVRGNVSDNVIKSMGDGMTLEDGTKLLPIKIESQPFPDGTTLLSMELRQGVNRQIRRMCAIFGLHIFSLKRVSEGSLRLGELKPGKTRILTNEEVDSLYLEVHLERKRN